VDEWYKLDGWIPFLLTNQQRQVLGET